MKQLALEWDDAYAKLRKVSLKLAKAAEREGGCKDCGPGEETPAGPGGAPNYMAIARQKYGNPWGSR